jgi:hypothetical protein
MSDVEDIQMPPTDDDTRARLDTLRSRFAPKEEERKPIPPVTPSKQEPAQPAPAPSASVYEVREQRKGGKPGPPTTRLDRKKFTIYLGEPEMQALEDAYKKMAHDIYPLEIEKANYLEACFSFLCEAYQQEQIRKRLQDK